MLFHPPFLSSNQFPKEESFMSMIQDKNAMKQRIIDTTLQAKRRNFAAMEGLTDRVSLSEYRDLIRSGEHGAVWTDALQAALNEHEIIVIPPSDQIYWIDQTLVVPSNRHIEATGATVKLVPEFPYIMLCNQHMRDGTHAPIDTSERDCNISIHGGTWGECCDKRGKRRLNADHPNTFQGVQTCMLFNNLDHLTITDITFCNANSFCVQIGDMTDGVFENFFFISCFADGLHINGNCENLYIRNFSGHVGDDLVALNMYDWLGSSINYGPCKNVFCEEIHSAPDSKAKALRLQPGIFMYRDGTKIDCSLEDMYFRKLSGMYEYKLYFQSPPYAFGEKPEGCGAGSADRIFFEDVDILSNRERYPLEHPETGYFGMFFMNSYIGYISLENIRYTKKAGDSPQNYLVAIGPMSWRRMKKMPDGSMVDTEVFDPYISGRVDTLDMKEIYINGEHITDVEKIVKVIEFHDVNHDGFSSGRGEVGRIFLDGKQVQ